MRTLSNSIALLSIFSAVNAYSAGLLNGSFETPVVVSSAQFQTIFSGAEPLGFGWNVTSGTVDAVIRGNIYGTSASDGLQWLDLDGISVGSISQTFSTVAGISYAIQFAYANHPLPGFTASFPATALVRVGDGVTNIDLLAPVAISHWNSTAANLNWSTSGSIAFTAIGSTTTLSFRSTDPVNSAGGIFLDAVAVSAVPEPTSQTLVLAGLLFVAGFSLRERRRELKSAA